jgi:acetyl esterase
MALNPAEKEFFEALARKNAKNPELANQEISLQMIRDWSRGLVALAGKYADAPYEDILIPVRNGAEIPARLFNPQLGADRPCLFFYPGCGYVSDNFEINAIASSRIADYANAKVFMVDLRKCPEFSLPIPMQDAYDVVKYVSAHAETFQVDPNNISVSGTSSGAHAAAYVANTSRDDETVTIKQQILLSGCFDLTNSQRDFDDYEAEDGLFQRGPVIDFIFDLWSVDKKDPAVSLVFDDSLTDLPKTIFLIPEYDGLRNDAEAYYKHLKVLNNDVQRINLPGQTHNTILLRDVLSDGVDPARVIADLL